MTSYYTAAEMVGFAKAYIAADAARMSQRPAGYPRAAWAGEHPIAAPNSFDVRDGALKTRPRRSLAVALNGNAYDLWVWTVGGKRGRCIERIDLRAADADARLARYERP